MMSRETAADDVDAADVGNNLDDEGGDAYESGGRGEDEDEDEDEDEEEVV